MINYGKIIAHASSDKEKNIEVLKKTLYDNDFKLCSRSAIIMLGEMTDMGLEEDVRAYWESLALLHLPIHPWEALKL